LGNQELLNMRKPLPATPGVGRDFMGSY